MSINKWIVHTLSGELKVGGQYEPQRPVLSVVNGITQYDPDYDVVVVPEGTSPRLHRWSGGVRVDKTAAETLAWDAAQPRLIDNRVFLDRFTDPEYDGFLTLAATDLKIRRLRDTLLASSTVDLNSPRLIAGLAYLKSKGVPTIWATSAAADSRLATLRGLA